ncbi:MAG: single-stranded DNA-binding protein [Bacilli bacterium]|nr:single-stranded DNA-binding protein [Bacilli bacterium]
MNKVCLVGRLVKDPTCEYVNTSNGSVARSRFTIAVDRSFVSSNQDGRNTADFISIVAWRKQAENIAKFQKKGNQVAVDGRIQVDSYAGKDGNTVWTTYVVADSIQFLDRKGDSVSNGNFETSSYDSITPSDFSSDSSEQGASVWDSGSNIEIDPGELPFY